MYKYICICITQCKTRFNVYKAGRKNGLGLGRAARRVRNHSDANVKSAAQAAKLVFCDAIILIKVRRKSVRTSIMPPEGWATNCNSEARVPSKTYGQ